MVRSCINLFNLGADGKGVDSTNNLWIVHECSPIIHEGGGRGGDQSLVRGLESFGGFENFKIFSKTWQEVIDSSASRVRQDIVDVDLIKRLRSLERQTN